MSNTANSAVTLASTAAALPAVPAAAQQFVRSAVHASGVRTRRVSDAPTRILHAMVGICFVGAYLSSDSERWQWVHASFGYSMLAALAFRFLYGFWGPRPVRWSSWLSKWHSGWQWLCGLSKLSNRLSVNLRAGQNFALLTVTSALLVLPMPIFLSGHVLYVSSTDWPAGVHEALSNLMLLLVMAHLSLLVLLSVLRSTNLASPMWSGQVPGPGPDVVTQPRKSLALVLLVSAVSFGVWAARAAL